MISVGAATLGELFMASAGRQHARPALWVEGDFLRYDELRAAAMRLAAGILAASAHRNGSVRHCALLVDRSRTAYASILGALLAGFAYVPLNPHFPADRLRRVLDASKADVLVVDAGSVGLAQSVVADRDRPLLILLPDLESPPDWMARLRQHRILCRSDLAQESDVRTPKAIASDDGAYLLFTSGSTGQPKGVLIRHRNAIAYIHNALSRYRPSPQDRFTQLFDFSFDLSVHDMFVCWGAGACLYCSPAGALTGLREFVRKHELTFWFSVPSTAAYMSRMRMLPPGSFPSLRMSLFCGEALPASLSLIWRHAAPASTIENLYGPTEATIAITAYRLPDDDRVNGSARPIVPIGHPLPGQHAAVIGPEGHPVPDGQPGELYLAGSQVASGYWQLPEMTASRFVRPQDLPDDAPQHWYRTGDRVVKDPDCGLLFLGRLDHETKIRGYRVDLQEIEAVVRTATGNESVAALPWPPDDEAKPTRSVAVFIAGPPTATAEIIAQCQAKLPPAVVPRHIYFVPEWPLTANGKTNYAALKQRMKEEQC